MMFKKNKQYPVMANDMGSFSFYFIKDDKLAGNCKNHFYETDRLIMTSTKKALQLYEINKFMKKHNQSKIVNEINYSAEMLKEWYIKTSKSKKVTNLHAFKVTYAEYFL